MRRRRRAYFISTLVCLACGMEMTIPRDQNHIREEGHIKNLYCPRCKEIQKFVEYNNITRYYKNIDGDIITE